MRTKIIYAALGLIAGLVIGFTITNELNRRDIEVLRAQVAQARSGTATAIASENAAAAPPDSSATDDDDAPRLTREEVKTAVARADEKASDVYQQRYLGQMLYLYASQTDDAETLSDAARLLERAHTLDPKNYETLVLLGNALFDLGNKGDAAKFVEARKYYALALKQQSADTNVRTDYGLTFFLARPSEPARAIEEYRKSLQTNPRHEITWQNLVAALIAINKLDEAEDALAQLKNVNAANQIIARLQAQLAQARHAAEIPNADT